MFIYITDANFLFCYHLIHVECSMTMLFYILDTSPFLVKDKDAEKQYKFDLQRLTCILLFYLQVRISSIK